MIRRPGVRATPGTRTGNHGEAFGSGGHVEPRLGQHCRPFYERIVGRQNRDLEAAVEAWRFFHDKLAEPNEFQTHQPALPP